jgi:hypothetical protein
MVSIFSPDDRPLTRLKQAPLWPAIKAVMVKHLQKRLWGLWVAVGYGIMSAVTGPDAR